ncbi:MAG: prepilin peptidase [Marmoricola sp.]|nr:prepilin peptidase [Marmoricola sp.]
MNWSDPAHAQAALACLLVCGGLGWFVPPAISRLPEPEPEPATSVSSEASVSSETDASGGPRRVFERALPPRTAPKEPYADIAGLPHLAPLTAAAAALVGALVGLVLGWTGALLYLVPLVPIGVALMVIDWRTTLLPNRILHPTYVLLAVLIPLAALMDQDLDSLYRAGWGWLLVGGWFWLFWWLVNAWGFGDVRLSRVLGPALGYLGWSQMLMGLVLILFVGALGGLAMAVARRSLRVRVPYGPWMLLGALLAVLVGPWLARSLGY